MYYDHSALMLDWKESVITLLRTALLTGKLRARRAADEAEAMLLKQEARDWIIRVQSLGSKEHFLQYAGRYVRRPAHRSAAHHVHRRENHDLLGKGQEAGQAGSHLLFPGRFH
jgi:hypothetical protein